MKVLLAKPYRSRVEIVNDIDCDMIHFFNWARHQPDRLCDAINSTPCHEALALGARQALAQGRLSGIDRAVAYWVAYQTGFNAMVSTGRYGSSPFTLLDTRIDRRRLRKFSERMLGVDLRATDFRRVLDSANKKVPGGVFFYLDPPYDQTEGYSTMQGASSFGWDLQCELFDYCVRIHEIGNHFIQTNSSTDRLQELYSTARDTAGQPIFHLTQRMVRYSVAGKSEAREEVAELLISNYPLRATQQGMFS